MIVVNTIHTHDDIEEGKRGKGDRGWEKGEVGENEGDRR
jgi:hypothetical protein